MSASAQGTSVPSLFSFEEKPLRAVVIDGEPWFVAADVCKILELGNPTNAVAVLDEDERTLTLIKGANNQERQTNVINDSGLYTLTLRCRDAVKKGSLPHRFRKKVTAEILPAIRKTGRYEATSQSSDIRMHHSIARLDIELCADRTFTIRKTAINEYTAADMLCAMARATVEIVSRTDLRRAAP
ncbi:Putative BRO family, N-domain protein [Candidatus Glomeribacter gigasporarum BEG34]|uniref:Putative BRO family, N-domain protein n=1 Tax=Candidatus Glomeribacter gigasporarum BEG34 TaxID=1070319 RepID=G2JAW9_9BURK|nr:BRO family protein [Candidatus Glomeribacter gigasporarum]CCD29921.1 Putative BRO family, N-domain protein [Candidatus Glomeribacter gigasporarum BEG34]